MTGVTRRTVLVLLLASIAIGAWANGDSEAAADQEGPVSLSYWEHQFPWLVEWNKAAVADYMAENPDVTITFNIDHAHQRDLPAMFAGEGPSVSAPHGPKVIQQMMARQLAPVDLEAFPEFDTYDEMREAFFPGSLDPFTDENGAIYAIPLEYDIPGLTVNEALLKKAGIDPSEAIPEYWDELGEVAGKVFSAIGTDESGNVVYEGWDWPYSNRRAWQRNEIRTVFAQYGARFVDEDGNVLVDSPEAVEAMTMMRDLVLKYKTGDPNALPGAEGRDWQIFGGTMAYGRFLAGEVAKMVAGEDVRDNLYIYPYPQVRGKNKVVTVRTHAWKVNADLSPKEQYEAWRFVNFLTQRWEELAIMGFNPVRIDQPNLDVPWYETEWFKQKVQEVQSLQAIPFDLLASGAVVWEIGSGLYGTKEAQLRNDEITDVVANAQERIIFRGDDVQTALTDARKQIEGMMSVR